MIKSVGHLADQAANDPGIGCKNRFAKIDHFLHMRGMGTRRMVSWIKLCLMQEQRLARLRWIMSHTQKDSRKWGFVGFANTIHIDEKRFYVIKDAQKIWLLPEDRDPSAPKAQSRAFLKKVMFLAAVGWPISGQTGHNFVDSLVFDPLLGRALRVDLARIELPERHELNLVSADGNVWRDMMVEQVFPSIRDAYKHLKKQVVIQIDGAKPYIESSIHASIKVECSKQVYNITLEQQPAQSLDFNVLELGILHSLQVQASQIKESRNLQEVINAVAMAFYNHDSNTLERMWQALFHVSDTTLCHNMDNDFPVPHTGTGAVQIRRDLPCTWNVNAQFLNKVRICLGTAQRG